MKIVSVLVFAAALIGSWAIVHATAPISQTMHVGIQNDLKQIIAEYVQKNLPESKNLRFNRFWTETVKANQVRANFSYSFEDESANAGNTTIEVQGTAMLTKGEETDDTVTWNLNELHISDNTVDFQEPIQITAGKNTPAETNE